MTKQDLEKLKAEYDRVDFNVNFLLAVILTLLGGVVGSILTFTLMTIR